MLSERLSASFTNAFALLLLFCMTGCAQAALGVTRGIAFSSIGGTSSDSKSRQVKYPDPPIEVLESAELDAKKPKPHPNGEHMDLRLLSDDRIRVQRLVWRENESFESASIPLCETPCRLQLPEGHYRFEFDGKKVDFHAANDDRQSWWLKRRNSGATVGGWVLTGLSIGGLGIGGILASLGALATKVNGKRSDVLVGGLIAMGAGVVTLVPGLVLLLNVAPPSHSPVREPTSMPTRYISKQPAFAPSLGLELRF